MLRSPFLNLRNQVNRHDNSTVIFTGTNESLTHFVKVLLVKVSEFVKIHQTFHRQNFALYSNGTYVIT